MSEPTSKPSGLIARLNGLVDGEWLGELSHGELRVWLALNRFADADGVAWPSNATLAGLAGAPERNTRRFLARLTEMGLVIVESPGGGCQRTAKRRLVTPGTRAAITRAAVDTIPGLLETANPGCGEQNTRAALALRMDKRTDHRTDHRTDQGAAASVSALDLPFEGEEFGKAWADFKQHRKELKKTLTPTCAEALLKDLAAMGEAGAVAALNRSIAAGWQGVFADRNASKATSKRAGEYAETIVL